MVELVEPESTVVDEKKGGLAGAWLGLPSKLSSTVKPIFGWGGHR